MTTVPSVVSERRGWPPRQLALGLSPTPRAGMALLLGGLALGPSGLGLLDDSVVTSLDPVVSVALAALGALIGSQITLRRPREAPLLGVACLGTAITILTVAGGIVIVQLVSSVTSPTWWLLALMLGVCAAPSSRSHCGTQEPHNLLDVWIEDVGDVLPVVLCVFAIAWVGHGTIVNLGWLVAQSVLIAAAVALATWLLITATLSESEQRVFLIGALLLLGGTAAHLSVSALFAGLVGGMLWTAAGGGARESVVRDLRYLQHPLIVVLLVVAGARLALAREGMGLIAAYVVLTFMGKLIGRAVAGAVASSHQTADSARALDAPGVVGLAIAVDVLLAGGLSGRGADIFAIVGWGTIGSEFMSLLVFRRDGRR